MQLHTDEKLIQTLQTGGVAVIPTDTIFGVVGKADEQHTVERIYQIKGRSPEKPTIILISTLADLELFGVHPDLDTQTILKQLWPGHVSVILPCPHTWLAYLHRETDTLAFRLPPREDLRQLIAQTGPLIAPSANPEGLPPATTINEAQAYFGDTVDYYPPSTEACSGAPSTLVAIQDGRVIIKRQGSAIIPETLL